MKMRLYARVSTKKQGEEKFGLERQIIEFKNAGYSPDEYELYIDEISGTKKNRPGLDRLKNDAEPGSKIICVSLDRLGRSTVDVIELIEYFRSRDVSIVFLKEHLSTDKNDAFSEFFITMLAAFSTLERNLMLERQAAAYQAMREQGIPLKGRPKVDPAKLQASIELYESGNKSLRDVAAITGVSASRISRELKARREMLQ